MEKMTNVKALDYVLANCEISDEVREKLVKMKEQFVKKNSADRKPTATQTENAGLKVAIVNGMEVGKQYTITDLMKAIPELADLSNQRVSAIVRQLKDEGTLVREEIKRKAYFSLAEVEVEGEDEQSSPLNREKKVLDNLIDLWYNRGIESEVFLYGKCN